MRTQEMNANDVWDTHTSLIGRAYGWFAARPWEEMRIRNEPICKNVEGKVRGFYFYRLTPFDGITEYFFDEKPSAEVAMEILGLTEADLYYCDGDAWYVEPRE